MTLSNLLPHEAEPSTPRFPVRLMGQLEPNAERLRRALGDLPLGAYDDAILGWLATWEPSTVEVIATWIERARHEGTRGDRPPVRGCVYVTDDRGTDARWRIVDAHTGDVIPDAGAHDSRVSALAECAERGWSVLAATWRALA